MAVLIGISGDAGVGKDTAASALVGIGFKQLYLSAYIKDAAIAWFGFTHEQCYGPTEKRAERSPFYPDGPTCRHVLEFLGTEVGRACHPDVWVNLTLKEWCARQPKHRADTVIADVRFKNEMEAIRAAGGKLVRIKRDVRLKSGASESHQSVTEQRSIPDEYFDAVLLNNKSPVHLKAQMIGLAYLFEHEGEAA